MLEDLPVFGRHHVPTASGSWRPDEPIMWLSCEVHGDVTTVSVAGEVDLSNAHLLAELLENVAGVRAPLVVVHLAEVTFFGAHGTEALVRARRLLTERGGKLVLHRPSRAVRRVLDVTGTLPGFEIVTRLPPDGVDQRPARPVAPDRAGVVELSGS
ncbi:anti-anti-sigma factor [Micromonospora sediminicola]|uniref:Anti-sigma factor antagonist n=2 Tax=Micromonosporaceae TaxID=28056 RepID=A0A1A9BHQ1_9ACTN|nr:anti-sigma factor antagonist [Micromonospora sp. WMMA1996]SBT69050.1 anti-anti-sigma factor [Micromonospora sediminicola]